MRNEQIKSPILRDLINRLIEVPELYLKEEGKEKEKEDEQKDIHKSV